MYIRTADEDGSEKPLTADDPGALDAPDGKDADARLDSEEEEGHGEVSAGDDVLRGCQRCQRGYDGGAGASGIVEQQGRVVQSSRGETRSGE